MLSKRSFINKAKKFSQSVKIGKTYYSIVDMADPCGPKQTIQEWVFTRKSKLTGQPMCRNMSATAVYMYTDGRISDKRPAGMKTVHEWSELNNSSMIPLEGYDPPPGWTFTEGSDPEDMWEEYSEWHHQILKKYRMRGKW